MTFHFSYIVLADRYGLVKVSYIIQFDLPPHAVDFTHKIIFGSDIYRGCLWLSLDVNQILSIIFKFGDFAGYSKEVNLF